MTLDSLKREKKKLVQMLLRDPKKNAEKFVDGFIQADQAMKLFKDAGFGRSGMLLTDIVQEVLDSIGDDKIL